MTDSKAETQEKYDKAFEYVLQTLKDSDSISIENAIGLCRDYRRDIDPRMVAEVLENMRREGWFIPNPETPSSPWLKLSMHGKEQSKQAHPVLAPAKRSGKLIEDTTLPDDFYKRVVNEINILFTNNHPIPICILVRKLFENLIIDILRKRYGMSDVSIFFDASHRKFHGFSKLLMALSERKTDFAHIASNLDDIINKINKFRENGNASAHSIDVDITMDQIAGMKDDINYLVPMLVSIRGRL
jgi:hypothetical protein